MNIVELDDNAVIDMLVEDRKTQSPIVQKLSYLREVGNRLSKMAENVRVKEDILPYVGNTEGMIPTIDKIQSAFPRQEIGTGTYVYSYLVHYPHESLVAGAQKIVDKLLNIRYTGDAPLSSASQAARLGAALQLCYKYDLPIPDKSMTFGLFAMLLEKNQWRPKFINSFKMIAETIVPENVDGIFNLLTHVSVPDLAAHYDDLFTLHNSSGLSSTASSGLTTVRTALLDRVVKHPKCGTAFLKKLLPASMTSEITNRCINDDAFRDQLFNLSGSNLSEFAIRHELAELPSFTKLNADTRAFMYQLHENDKTATGWSTRALFLASLAMDATELAVLQYYLLEIFILAGAQSRLAFMYVPLLLKGIKNRAEMDVAMQVIENNQFGLINGYTLKVDQTTSRLDPSCEFHFENADLVMPLKAVNGWSASQSVVTWFQTLYQTLCDQFQLTALAKHVAGFKSIFKIKQFFPERFHLNLDLLHHLKEDYLGLAIKEYDINAMKNLAEYQSRSPFQFWQPEPIADVPAYTLDSMIAGCIQLEGYSVAAFQRALSFYGMTLGTNGENKSVRFTRDDSETCLDLDYLLSDIQEQAFDRYHQTDYPITQGEARLGLNGKSIPSVEPFEGMIVFEYVKVMSEYAWYFKNTVDALSLESRVVVRRWFEGGYTFFDEIVKHCTSMAQYNAMLRVVFSGWYDPETMWEKMCQVSAEDWVSIKNPFDFLMKYARIVLNAKAPAQGLVNDNIIKAMLVSMLQAEDDSRWESRHDLMDEDEDPTCIDNVEALDTIDSLAATLHQLRPKSDSDIPLIDEVFSSKGKQYRVKVLPPGDIRALIIGTLTGCCQHIEGAASSVARSSYTDSQEGVLVVETLSGRVLYQSLLFVDDYNIGDLDEDDLSWHYSQAVVAKSIKTRRGPIPHQIENKLGQSFKGVIAIDSVESIYSEGSAEHAAAQRGYAIFINKIRELGYATLISSTCYTARELCQNSDMNIFENFYVLSLDYIPDYSDLGDGWFVSARAKVLNHIVK